MDLVLSSGFLAFARQCGFLLAVEEAGIEVDGVVGTSSGALAGSLWTAGLSAAELARELSSRRPLSLCSPHLALWRGLFTMDSVIEHISELLPARFEDLPRPFGVGVMTAAGEHRLVTSGPLPRAVAASMAIPRLFAPVSLDGVPCADGAFVSRTAFEAWQTHRGAHKSLVHLVEATSGSDVEPDFGDSWVVRTPRSGAKLWSLGDFRAQLEEARDRTTSVIAAAT
ncbi:MAG TPA: patatin-like phospholipase family protein [Myxococcota bacterium]|nr:patatin-like phospholipase family protein [Myxococcota bacterium]